MDTTTEVGTYEGKTAEQWRAEAKAQYTEKSRSERDSDTDGFMSQWACGITAREYELKAVLAERGAWTKHLAVFDLDGNLVPAKMVQGKYGMSWMLLNERGRCAGWFSPSFAKKDETRIANNAKKGFYEGTVKVKAVVDIRGGNVMTVSAGIFAESDEMTAETVIEIIDNGR